MFECHEQTRSKNDEELNQFLSSLIEDQIKSIDKNRNEMEYKLNGYKVCREAFCAAYNISKNKVNLISKKIRNELVTDANPDFNFNQKKCNVSNIDILQENLSNLSNSSLPKDYWNDWHLHDGFDYSTTEEIFNNNLKTFGLFMKV